MMIEQLEVGASEAPEVFARKKPVYVLAETYKDLEVVKRRFGLGDEDVVMVDMNDFYPAIMNYGEDSDLKAIAKKYDGALIVCPHGISSKAFAEAIRSLGANAYSLKGGLEGLASQ